MKLKNSTQQLGARSRTGWHVGKADLKRSRRGPIRPWKGRFKLPLPRRTVRLRLTLLYSSLFLASGAGLLAINYVLVAQRITGLVSVPTELLPQPTAPRLGTPSKVSGTDPIAQLLRAQAAADLHQLLVQSGIALSIMAVIAIVLGWVVAGRVLRPLQTMTTTTRQISEKNLHERLALPGPPDELKDLGDTIDGLLARLEAAFEAQRRFVANASHELRTPLTLERAMIEVALADPHADEESLRAVCERVLAAGAEQERVIEALLTLARSQREIEER